MTGQGFAAVCPNYRLYPNARFPDFLWDAAEACAWVKNNLQQFVMAATRFSSAAAVRAAICP